MARPRKADAYSLNLKTAGQVFSGEGRTIKEAFSKIDLDVFKTKGVLKVSKGDRSKEIVLAPLLLRRIKSPIYREIFEKRLTFLMS